MSSSKISTIMTSSVSEEVIITPLTSETTLDKPKWEGKPAFEPSNPVQEDFNDIGDNWSDNAWPTEEALKDPFNSILPSSNGCSSENSWGTGPPVEIPTYHTHFTVLDSMDQRSGYTHYLLESNRGLLFHGHQRTSEWTLVSRTNSDNPPFALLPELIHVRADFLFPAYHPSMTRFPGSKNEPRVFMKKQPLLTRRKFRNAHHASCTRQEIARCEHISRTPHPNLARYLGVETARIGSEERVVRIAYKRYNMDLHTFVLVKRYLQPYHVPVLMRGIEKGMRHLHSLGLVHCDLRPVNVFVSVEEGGDARGGVGVREVVIGDFDASVEIGEEVSLKRASGDWWPTGVEWGVKAETQIDEWCLGKMEKWLKEDGLGVWDFGAPAASTSERAVDRLAGDVVAAMPKSEW